MPCLRLRSLWSQYLPIVSPMNPVKQAAARMTATAIAMDATLVGSSLSPKVDKALSVSMSEADELEKTTPVMRTWSFVVPRALAMSCL